MACFIVPMSLGIATTLFRKKIPEALKISWLNIMLWGGVLMLAVEHIAHEEVVLYPPFLTAMQTPAEIPVMLEEMATIGGSMTIAIICIWITLVAIAHQMTKTKQKTIQS
ncbi:MAG: hypothetical protein QXX20_07450 [Candidatus Thermoplasmatota archaeon]